jgi:carbon-monoxide dehydrogenase medium subunit/xanthine dehydrogenase FAD-binding subunit
MLTCDTYITAHTLDEAFAAMAANASSSRFVAGGTDLLPWAREGRAGDVHISALIDIARIPELGELSICGSVLRLGAATPLQRFLDHPDLRAALPCMPHCAVWFADDQIRELATLGGNLVNASPAADTSPPMLSHNARVELAAKRGGGIERRWVSLDQFFHGPGRTAMAPDEILVAIECDSLRQYGGSFQKVGHRRSLVISVACVAALVKLDPSRRHFEDVRLAVGGIGPVPRRLTDTEALLRGAPINSRIIEQASTLPLDLVQSRTRRAYRRSVLHGFIARALIDAVREAGGDVHSVMAELEATYA